MDFIYRLSAVFATISSRDFGILKRIASTDESIDSWVIMSVSQHVLTSQFGFSEDLTLPISYVKLSDRVFDLMNVWRHPRVQVTCNLAIHSCGNTYSILSDHWSGFFV